MSWSVKPIFCMQNAKNRVPKWLQKSWQQTLGKRAFACFLGRIRAWNPVWFFVMVEAWKMPKRYRYTTRFSLLRNVCQHDKELFLGFSCRFLFSDKLPSRTGKHICWYASHKPCIGFPIPRWRLGLVPKNLYRIFLHLTLYHFKLMTRHFELNYKLRFELN